MTPTTIITTKAAPFGAAFSLPGRLRSIGLAGPLSFAKTFPGASLVPAASTVGVNSRGKRVRNSTRPVAGSIIVAVVGLLFGFWFLRRHGSKSF